MPLIVRPESPGGNAMTIYQDQPQGAGAVAGALDGVVPSVLIIQTSQGIAGALTRAGLVAMVAAAASYVAGLSAGNADIIANTLPGGLALSISRTKCVLPVAPGQAATLATAVAAVLNVGANVTSAG
ncbi:hypothetical protein Dvina_01485 [Dactylosporangium vinaceum]|uniref:Uncharacterized protein n=1 Tax=Dactylosporangium vinaceum TaxID=53362 RepID=A0ABV5MLQ9_9ACTN|nr:hypothetical protein [Dactylosporangium vinaceum]UAB96931.1 hypothetical protein Dvina_01485 [Dactylosporangium vinaceum]